VRDVAVVLGAAARLRGAHDRRDPQVRALLDRGRDVPGFDEAYLDGWRLDPISAVTKIGSFLEDGRRPAR
jgi:hypothetical protein